MNKFMTKVARGFSKTMGKVKAHSPEILLGCAVAGLVTSVVAACMETPKAVEVIDQTKEQLFAVEVQDGTVADKIEVCAVAGVKLAKTYLPATLLFTASLGGVFAGHAIMANRLNKALAAYTSLDILFKTYRGQAKEEIGEDAEKIIYAESVESVAKMAEKGYEELQGDYGSYGKWVIKEENDYWKSDNLSIGEYITYLTNVVQRTLNDNLKIKGYIFLNDVLKVIGLEPTQAGQLVGWMYDPTNPNIDNYINFDIYEDGSDDRFFIDFNVDGLICDKIGLSRF